jgi:adenosine deaminase
MRPGTVVELAERYGVQLPEGLREGRYEFRDFRQFIDEWVAGLECLREPDDFRRIALEFCEDEAVQGVPYAEVSLSLPDHRGRIRDWDATLSAVLEGFAEGERRVGIVCRTYVDVVRGIDLEFSRRAMEVAANRAGDGVIGIGLGGEERFGPEPYASIFREGIERGLHSIPHAGETVGPASIRGAIDALGAERIGHGISVLEDPALVDEVRERGIAFDVCPTSNLMTRSSREAGSVLMSKGEFLGGAPTSGDARLWPRMHPGERRPVDVPLTGRRRVRGMPARVRVRRRAIGADREKRSAGLVRAGVAQGGARGGNRRLAGRVSAWDRCRR